MSEPTSDREPSRLLGAPTAALLVVASMVGTGVFTTTGFLIADVKNLPAVLVAWGLGGILALFGALAYGELAAALPRNGGEYQLLSRIYHPSVGFTSGFTSLVVGFSAPIAASAIAFAEYLNRALGGPVVPPLLSAVGLVVLTSVVHAVRVNVGGGFQNVMTAGKIVLVAVFVVGGFFAGDLGLIGEGSTRPFIAATISPELAVGLVYVSFAYSGWNAAAYVAGEIKKPSRNLPLALLGGTLLVTVLYLGVNTVFLAAAPATELAAAGESVGSVAAEGLFGERAGRLLSGMIALGLVSTVGALVMTGPRIYEAMGNDFPAIRILATRRVEGGPVYAIALQAAVALVMVVTATFDQLLVYIGFTLSFFAALTVAGVFVLRVREPDLPRPYRTWGHPVTEVAFILLMGWMMVHSVIEKPAVSLTGIGTLVLGGVVYLLLVVGGRRTNAAG